MAAQAIHEYLLLMHDLPPDRASQSVHTWPEYLAALHATGMFEGGSAMGDGICVSKEGPTTDVARHLTGYIRVRAESLEAAQAFLAGNPVYEAGGTIEIRELPQG